MGEERKEEGWNWENFFEKKFSQTLSKNFVIAQVGEDSSTTATQS